MREVLKTRFEIYIGGFSFLFKDLVMGQLQAFPGKPFLRGGIVLLLKIPFESGEASAGEIYAFDHIFCA